MSSVNAKLVKVARRIATEGISKTRKNSQQGYNFRGVDEVMNAFAPILAEEGLYLRPKFSDRNVVERTSKNGGVIFYVALQGEFTFSDESGESVTVGPFYGEAMDSADKATNKAMAVAFKYAMFQTFCVPLEGVTGGDADAVTHEIQPISKASPLDGVWDSLDAEQQQFIEAQAAKVRQAFEDGGAEVAAQLIYRDLNLDNDEIMALWTRLPSNIRNQSKKFKDQITKEAA